MSDATEAWEKYLDGDADDGYHDQERPAFLAGFAAGQVAALKDAASKLDLSDRYDPSPLGLVSRECQAAETKAQEWLRARAAELSKEQHDQPDA